MKIVRTEYVTVTRKYVLEVTPQLLDGITESLKHKASDPDDIPTITEDYIRDAVDYEDIDKKNIEIVFNGCENSTYTTDLFDTLRDCLDGYIWDADYEDVDDALEDYEDEIIY